MVCGKWRLKKLYIVLATFKKDSFHIKRYEKLPRFIKDQMNKQLGRKFKISGRRFNKCTYCKENFIVNDDLGRPVMFPKKAAKFVLCTFF